MGICDDHVNSEPNYCFHSSKEVYEETGRLNRLVLTSIQKRTAVAVLHSLAAGQSPN